MLSGSPQIVPPAFNRVMPVYRLQVAGAEGVMGGLVVVVLVVVVVGGEPGR